MAKRATILFFFFALFIGVLGMRLLTLPQTQAAQLPQGRMTVTLDHSRGAIYDCRGVRLVQADGGAQTIVVAKPTPEASLALKSILNEKNWRILQERLEQGGLVSTPVDVDTVECPDLRLFTAYPRYSGSPLAPHLIGYLNGSNEGVSGLELGFDSLLSAASGDLRAALASDAYGHSLVGAQIEAEDDGYRSAAGIQITLDARIQRIVQDAMIWGDIDLGAVVVLDAQTSEIRALASSPAFDQNNIAASLNDPREPFLNRALRALPVGSTFKCFVAAAALEQRVPASRQYTCAGSIDVGGQTFYCNNREGHGTLDMGQALTASCNLYFIQLAQQLEPQPMLDLISLFGFGEALPLALSLASAAGNLPSAEALSVPAELANFSFGQGALLAAPIQIAAATACLAADGVYHTPRLMTATVDGYGEKTPWIQDTEQRQVVAAATAAQLRAMMIQAVEQGSARSAKPDVGSAGGKTATAQVGQYTAAGVELKQAGFTGFFPADQPRYVITVIKQNGGSGSTDCAPVFRRIANAIIAQGIS
ncbi:MAG: penicillin-binding protein 2 [Oscillospiraceae bacterium]|nr:penicillin-binding protein 2 [Oscillospiraceae bacterium]